MNRMIVFLFLAVFLLSCASPAAIAPYPTPTLPPISIEPADTTSLERLQIFGNGTVSQLAWSPDGKQIAAVGSTGVRFYDVEKLKETLYMPTPYLLTSLAFSTDGQYLITGSADTVFSRRAYWRRFSPWGSKNNYVQLWDTKSGDLLATLEGGNSYITTVTFSPDDALIVSGSNYSDDNAIRIWELASVLEGDAEPKQIYRDHTRGVFQIEFSPSGELLLSGSGDNSARLWDFDHEANNRILMYRSAAKVKVFALSYRPVIDADGTELVALAGADFFHNTPTALLELWDVGTGELIAELNGHESSLDSVEFSPNGEILASGGSYPDNKIHLWDVERKEIVRTLAGHHSGVRSLAFSPNGKMLASSGWDGLIHLWDVATGELLQTNSEHTSVVHSVAFDAEENLLATGGDEGFIRLWDVGSGALVDVFNTESSRVTSLLFFKDSPYLLAGTDEPSFDLQLWDIEKGEMLRNYSGHQTFSQVLALSADEKIIASGGSLGDNTLYLWNLDSTKPTYAIEDHLRSVKSVTFSLNSDLILSGDGKGTLRFINSENGEIRFIAEEHPCAITALFVLDEEQLLSGDCAGNIYRWDADGVLLDTLSTQDVEIKDIQQKNDEILVLYQDGSLQVLSFLEGETLLKMEGISNTLFAFFSGEREIALLSENLGGETTLWKLSY